MLAYSVTPKRWSRTGSSLTAASSSCARWRHAGGAFPPLSALGARGVAAGCGAPRVSTLFMLHPWREEGDRWWRWPWGRRREWAGAGMGRDGTVIGGGDGCGGRGASREGIGGRRRTRDWGGRRTRDGEGGSGGLLSPVAASRARPRRRPARPQTRVWLSRDRAA